MHETTRPCRLKPGFLQPGEHDNWHHLPDTRAAVEMCHHCPARTTCAREALEHGTPDGVVQAGIICRGDTDTRTALQAVAGIRTPSAGIVDLDELRKATHCSKCRRRLISRSRQPHLGEAHRGGRGLCKPCHTTVSRAGELQPRIGYRPPACNGCHLPMVARKRAAPPGHVEHEAHGYCRTCVRARRYAEETTAA